MLESQASPLAEKLICCSRLCCWLQTVHVTSQDVSRAISSQGRPSMPALQSIFKVSPSRTHAPSPSLHMCMCTVDVLRLCIHISVLALTSISLVQDVEDDGSPACLLPAQCPGTFQVCSSTQPHSTLVLVVFWGQMHVAHSVQPFLLLTFTACAGHCSIL